jgi:hypothetical protein
MMMYTLMILGSIIDIGDTTLSIITFSLMTLSITTFSIMTLSIKFKYCGTQYCYVYAKCHLC